MSVETTMRRIQARLATIERIRTRRELELLRIYAIVSRSIDSIDLPPMAMRDLREHLANVEDATEHLQELHQ